MSRSFKKRPFIAICGNTGSAKKDKVVAHRAERRTVNREIHRARNTNYEDFISPLRRECAHNDVWGWGRDGNQTYQGLNAHHWFDLHQEVFRETERSRYMSDDTWPPQWYLQMMRK